MEHSIPRHIRLTSHPGDAGRSALPLRWGAPVAAERGPVVASPADPQRRNAIGSYSGAYAIYRALAVATQALARDHRPDLTDTAPAARIAPHPQWTEPKKIVSIDPWGHLVGEVFAEHIRAGIDVRPTIAITTARLATPELRPLLAEGKLRADGQVLLDSGEIRVTKAAIDPVFGSDICTCRPYLVHGIAVCVETAQRGGVGIIVYNRKEGRALGEVTKFLVYNARKRQPGGDTVDSYFRRTECVAGVQDMRFQELMPDVFHWLGIRRIDHWVSMSNVKRDALEAQGIEVVEQLAIPDRLVPLDAAVEIEAKKAAGYFSPSGIPDPGELHRTRGRALGE